MTPLIIVGVVLGLLVLGYYLGWKVTHLNAAVEVRDEYIQRQTAILGSFVRAIQRGEDLAQTIKDLGDASTPAALGQLYEQILSKADGANSGVVEKPIVPKA